MLLPLLCSLPAAPVTREPAPGPERALQFAATPHGGPDKESRAKETEGRAVITEIVCGSEAVKLSIDLVAGWNHISLNVVPNAYYTTCTDSYTSCTSEPSYLIEDIFVWDVTIPLDVGDQLKSQTSESQLYSYGWNSRFWWGSLTELVPTEGYKLKLGAAGVLQVCGVPIDVCTTPVPIAAGWNWIPYLRQEPASLDALRRTDNEGWAAGDKIMSRKDSTFTTWYAGYGWYGTLTQLRPGLMYTLKSANAGTISYAPKQPPVLTVVGEETMTLERDSVYLYTDDLGATATGTCGESLSHLVEIGGDIVRSDAGVIRLAAHLPLETYTITYDVTDADGYAAEQKTRTIHVIEPEYVTDWSYMYSDADRAALVGWNSRGYAEPNVNLPGKLQTIRCEDICFYQALFLPSSREAFCEQDECAGCSECVSPVFDELFDCGDETSALECEEKRCELGGRAWTPCSKACGGGEQRRILRASPAGVVPCVWMETVESCNTHACAEEPDDSCAECPPGHVAMTLPVNVMGCEWDCSLWDGAKCCESTPVGDFCSWKYCQAE